MIDFIHCLISHIQMRLRSLAYIYLVYHCNYWYFLELFPHMFNVLLMFNRQNCKQQPAWRETWRTKS